MSQFDLSNFKNKNTEQLPSWVINGTDATRRLYRAIINEVNRMTADIINKKPLKIRERTLVSSRIAVLADCNKSLIHPRRQKEIVDLIGEENEKLKALWASTPTKTSYKPKKTVTSQDNEDLRAKCDKLENSNYTEYLQAAIESEVISSQAELAAKYAKLKIDYDMLCKKNAALQETNARLIEALNNR